MAQTFKTLLEEKLEYLVKIVPLSETLKEVCATLGYCDNGRNTGTLSKFLRANNIDFSHFRTSKWYPKHIIEATCPVCNTIFTKNLNSAKEVKKVTCSHDCGNKYFSWKQGAKNYKGDTASSTYATKLAKFYKSHSLVTECIVCGEKEILDVHHVDEDRLNAEINNLVYLCPNHHLLLHRNKSEVVFNKIIEHLDFRDTL